MVVETIRTIVKNLMESMPSEIIEMAINKDSSELEKMLEIDIETKHKKLILILENADKTKEDIIRADGLRAEIDFEKGISNIIKFNP